MKHDPQTIITMLLYDASNAEFPMTLYVINDVTAFMVIVLIIEVSVMHYLNAFCVQQPLARSVSLMQSGCIRFQSFFLFHQS